MMQIYQALVACENLSRRTPLVRGESRRIYGDANSGGTPFANCVGVLASRRGGVLERKMCFNDLPDNDWNVLMKMTRRAECALESFADTSVLHQLTAAKQVVPFKTMSAPHSNECVKYFGALAFGRNVFLRCHTDEDFTMSVAQIYLKGSNQYHIHDKVVAFFCFPTRGVAIPMRPGDFLLFDTSLPHCVSSRCHNCDDIMIISFYLKSMVVGMNDNNIPLTQDQASLVNLHDEIALN